MIVVLDNIRSSQNVGSIFRTGDAVNVEEIYLCGVTPTPLDRFGFENKQLTKVSLKAENYVKWIHLQSLHDAIKILRKNAYTIIALEQNPKSIPYNSEKLKKINWEKTALILGQEVEGIDKESLGNADYIIEIPMLGKKESLNVAVAFGIAIYRVKEIISPGSTSK